MFFIPDLIQKKKQGLKLSKEEIQFIIDGYVNGRFLIIRFQLFLWPSTLKEWMKMRRQNLQCQWLIPEDGRFITN